MIRRWAVWAFLALLGLAALSGPAFAHTVPAASISADPTSATRSGPAAGTVDLGQWTADSGMVIVFAVEQGAPLGTSEDCSPVAGGCCSTHVHSGVGAASVPDSVPAFLWRPLSAGSPQMPADSDLQKQLKPPRG